MVDSLLEGVNTTFVYVTRARQPNTPNGGRFRETGIMFSRKEDVDRWLAIDPDNRRCRYIGVFNDYESYLRLNPHAGS